jgi:hypothetical protein
VSVCLTACLISGLTRVSARKRAHSAAETNAETCTEREQPEEVMSRNDERHQSANSGRSFVEPHR